MARSLGEDQEPLEDEMSNLVKAGFEPRNIDEAIHLAKVLHASRLLPRGLQTPEAVVATIITGAELGLSPMQAIRSIHIIDGKPTMSSDLMVAMVKRHEACKFFRLVESSGSVATYETQRAGDPEPTRMSFSIEEAKAAGLAGKDVWKKFAPAMLRARCASSLARAVYPDLVMGIYDPDELDHSPAPAPEPRDVTPPKPVIPQVVVEAAQTLDATIEEISVADSLREAMESAKTVADLTAVAAKVAPAQGAGQITFEERDQLRKIFSQRKNVLAAEAK
jgi:hypothetical protein